ncbi:MAG: NACHT domain-containing protein, partial [Desulfoferrobacter sp.]
MEIIRKLLEKLPFPVIAGAGIVVIAAWIIREYHGWPTYQNVFHNPLFIGISMISLTGLLAYYLRMWRFGRILLPESIMLSKLPQTKLKIFGREKELKILYSSWTDREKNVVYVVGLAGAGKTALITKWLSGMEKENYRGAERVFAWSFHPGGIGDGHEVSSDEFLALALFWFGDSEPEKGTPWDKGIRLANLVRRYRTLLILDGIEPLQSSTDGYIKDQGIKSLVNELLKSNQGLCILTSRLDVSDLANTQMKSQRITLSNLDVESSVMLLKDLGVDGNSEDLRDTALEYDGHALALTLLGGYLNVVHEGDVRKRMLIPTITDKERIGEQAIRVMEYYEKDLAGEPELNILYMIGLFDRPVDTSVIEEMLHKPPIEGLTSELTSIPKDKWKYALKSLRDRGLLFEEKQSDTNTIDCHALVRECFGYKFRQKNPEGWREAHSY